MYLIVIVHYTDSAERNRNYSRTMGYFGVILLDIFGIFFIFSTEEIVYCVSRSYNT